MVLEDAQSITVRLTNRNMFGSGEATLNSGYDPLLARIGTALQDEQGPVTVNGYTDNQPIHTARFPSNFELSQARADAVARMIAAKLSDPKRRAGRRQGRCRSDGPEHDAGRTPAEPPHRNRPHPHSGLAVTRRLVADVVARRKP